MGRPVVRTAHHADIPEIAAVLGHAFLDDPVAEWMIPDEDRRRQGMPRLFAYQLARFFIERGHTDAAQHEGRVAAAAMWTMPGSVVPLRTDAWEIPHLLEFVGPRRLGTVLAGFARMNRSRPKVPHWYLDSLGTSPLAQGEGLGRALLEAGITLADRDRVPAYLESSKALNTGFYERFGFEVVEHISLPGGPTVYAMLRTPQG